MTPSTSNSDRSRILNWVFRILGFSAMVAVAFSLPLFPALELDSSWRQAIGKFYFEGLQFGKEVVFTYGPLGFSMGKTYWGDHLTVLIWWHVIQAVVFSAVVYWHAYQLKGYSRIFFFGFFLLFGLSYQDAVHQTIIAFAGLALIRRSDQPWRWTAMFWLVLLVILSLVKFTNMLVAFFFVLLAGALEFYRTRQWQSLRVPAIFTILFLIGWRLCGQHISNLPAYFHSSWEISQGYLDAMGLAPNSSQLYHALIVAALVCVYLALNFLTAPDRIKNLALTLGTGGYLYVNWKHGFIRADGHQIGFYYAALTVMVGCPLLLADGVKWMRLKQTILFAAGLVSLFGMENVLPGLVRGALAAAQDKVNLHVLYAQGKAYTPDVYEGKMQAERSNVDLRKTKATVGRNSLDVLGYEQAVAIFNDFNYKPRPVFQGYSAYTPYLSKLNYDYYASDAAPEYVLFKLQTLDSRLATMDDPHALRLLIQRYTYLFSEQGFALWHRKPGAFDASAYDPVPIRSGTYHLGETIDLADLVDRNIWVEIDYHYSLLGKLRRFFYRPVEVFLHINDTNGGQSVHRLPGPIGRTGFMLNPVVDDMLEFMRAAGGEPKRRVASIRIDTTAQDRDCMDDEFTVSFSSLPASDAGKDYFKVANNAKFHMFVNAPISYEAHNPPSEDLMDGRRVMVMHAPSQMAFDVPAGSTMLQGDFGFIAGAYTNGGQTNGALFTVYWTDGSDRVILHERYLNPVKQLNDRGLQHFSARLPRSSGHVIMRIDPGPNNEFAYDWTAWTGIEFK
jgi:hypothetical protein